MKAIYHRKNKQHVFNLKYITLAQREGCYVIPKPSCMKNPSL